MKRYFVEMPSANSGQAAHEAVNIAYDEEGTVLVEGVRESVDVQFDLEVSRVTRSREGIRKLLTFSGVTIPKVEPYVAEFEESNENSPMITLEIRPEAKTESTS